MNHLGYRFHRRFVNFNLNLHVHVRAADGAFLPDGRFVTLPNVPRSLLGYRLDVPGRSGWLARYLKEVDVEDTTLRFWQEIYDDQGRLVETHEKYPLDKGHRKA